MNIFATSSCPVESAKYLDTKRVNKMILESAQILSTARYLWGYGAPYRPTHIHHPCVIWAASSKGNYIWLLQHFIALCDTFKHRRNKIHKCELLINCLMKDIHVDNMHPQTPHPNCAANSSLNISYKHIENVHDAYKLYLNDRWEHDKIEPTWS